MGLESGFTAMELLAFLLAKGASQGVYLCRRDTCGPGICGGLQMSLPACETEAAGISSQLTPGLSSGQAGMHVRASASKRVPETSYKGKTEPMWLVFQQELLSFRECGPPGTLSGTWWAGNITQPPQWMVETPVRGEHLMH